MPLNGTSSGCNSPGGMIRTAEPLPDALLLLLPAPCILLLLLLLFCYPPLRRGDSGAGELPSGFPAMTCSIGEAATASMS